MPVYKIIWHLFIVSRYSIGGIGRFIWNWFRWM
jgi:hypothetical protein